jgi:transposase
LKRLIPYPETVILKKMSWGNVVERCVNRLKQYRGVAMKYEERAANYRAVVVIAALVIWLTS